MDYGIYRFNGEDFLKNFKGKNFMFVGDSLSNNQWQSLACMLHAAVPNSSYTFDRKRNGSVLSFPVGRLNRYRSIIFCLVDLHGYVMILLLCYVCYACLYVIFNIALL